MRTVDRVQPFALLVLRIILGVILLAHGKGKLFGGLEAHKHMVAAMGMPGWMGYLSSTTEFVGGILLIVGLLTRFAGLAVVIEMLTVIFKIHLKRGMIAPGGYEFPMLVGTVAFVFIFFGAGPISLDWLFSTQEHRK